MTQTELVKKIELAFAEVSYPGDDRLVATVQEPEFAAAFTGRHWREAITPEFLSRNNTFPFFTCEAFVFYLPAYLIGAVMYPAEKYEWLSPLIHNLYPATWDVELGVNYIDRAIDLMTPVQRHTVRLFLEYLLVTEADVWAHDEPPYNLLASMLANHWNQF